MKGNPPQFHGEYNPEAIELWIQEIKKIFVAIYCREDRKVTYASFMLVGRTEAWQKNKQRLLEAEGRVITWELFMESFLEKHFLKRVRQVKEKEIMDLKQESMSIGEYAMRFEALLKFYQFYQVQPNEEWVFINFEDGLRPELNRAMLPLEICYFPALVEKCTVLEGHDRCGVVQPQSRSGGPICNNNQRGKERIFQQGHRPYKTL